MRIGKNTLYTILLSICQLHGWVTYQMFIVEPQSRIKFFTHFFLTKCNTKWEHMFPKEKFSPFKFPCQSNVKSLGKKVLRTWNIFHIFFLKKVKFNSFTCFSLSITLRGFYQASGNGSNVLKTPSFLGIFDICTMRNNVTIYPLSYKCKQINFIWNMLNIYPSTPNQRRPYNQVNINCSREFDFTDEKGFRNV